MEVKVNREIREYTEGVFFGMSLSAVRLRAARLRRRRGALLRAVALPETGRALLGVHRGAPRSPRWGSSPGTAWRSNARRAWAKYALLTPKELPARPQNLYYEAVCTPHRAKGIRREKGGHHGRTRS
ncbi:MAG: PrgI family protein [Adlercreutzia equolifaciens]